MTDNAGVMGSWDLVIATMAVHYATNSIHSMSKADEQEPGVIKFRFGNAEVEVIHGQVEVATSDCPTRMALALGIPKHVCISEFCAFIEPFTRNAVHLQIIEPDPPYDRDYYYGILIMLASESDCEEFCNRLHDRPFNGVEEDRCQMLRVVDCDMPRLPDRSLLDASSECCTVCLEVIASSGSVSILCRHQFHFNCLRNWKGNSNACPVCRHHMQPKNQPHCERCLVTNQTMNCNDLWICLVCGHVGCGRNVNSHALEHFHETCHTFALDITTRSVWDYAADNFVHRLIVGDGKLVEVGVNNISEDEADRSTFKLEEILDEYNGLLSSQLQEQCALFKKRQRRQSEQFERNLVQIEAEIDAILAQQDATRKRIALIEASNQSGEAQLNGLKVAEEQKATELKKLQQLNKNILGNQLSIRRQIESGRPNPSTKMQEQEAEIQSLEENLKDLKFYISSQRSVQASPMKDEIHGGSVIVLDNSSEPQKPNEPRRRRK